MLPYARYLQADRIKQRSEFFLRPLTRRDTSHDTQVKSSREPMRALVGQNKLIDQDFRRCRHGRLDLLQNVSARLVGVVVHDLVEEVCMRSYR